MFKNEFELGMKIGAETAGVSLDKLHIKKASQNILDNSFEMQQLYSRAGANVLSRAGMGDTIECRLLCKCASAQRLLSKEAQEMYIEPVKKAFEKYAEVSPKAVASAGVGLLGGGKSVFSALAAISAALGAAAGAGWWGIQRQSQLDDEETSVKFKQARKYRELARQIKDEIAYKQKQEENKLRARDTSIF